MKRIKKRNRKPSEIVESLSAAASRLGIELHHVQAAKKAGCIAFKPGGRVHLGELKAHLDKHPVSKASLPPLTDEQVAAQSNIEASLKGAIRDEIEIGRELEQARVRGNSAAVADLTLAIGRARKNRLAIEAAVTKLQVERGQLISLDRHRLEGFKLLRPILDAFRRIPRKATMEIAGMIGCDEGPVHKVLDMAVESAVGEARALLDYPNEEQKRLAKILLLMEVAGDDRRLGKASLVVIDSLRAFVLAELAEQAGETSPIEPEKPQITSEF